MRGTLGGHAAAAGIHVPRDSMHSLNSTLLYPPLLFLPHHLHEHRRQPVAARAQTNRSAPTFATISALGGTPPTKRWHSRFPSSSASKRTIRPLSSALANSSTFLAPPEGLSADRPPADEAGPPSPSPTEIKSAVKTAAARWGPGGRRRFPPPPRPELSAPSCSGRGDACEDD